MGEEALPNAVSTAQMQALGEAPFKGQSSPLGAGESVAPRCMCHLFTTREEQSSLR